METHTDLLTATRPIFDQTGKLSLDGVYNRPDPRDYFSTLKKLDYFVPELAKPCFAQLLEAKRAVKGSPEAKIIDVGCSYGVNAALLKHGLSMDDLYTLYAEAAPLGRNVLLARDKALFAGAADNDLSVVGIDSSEPAVNYALEVGMMDDGFAANLEKEDLTRAEARSVEDADMIISTGCVGYVTKTSLDQLIDANVSHRPWMANFVLRMFDYTPIEEMMAEHGYVTEKLEGASFRQRRFVSDEEHQHVIDNLAARGLAPKADERNGWYLAELYVSRPVEEASAPITQILH